MSPNAVSLDTQLIGQRFSRRHSTYDDAAVVQKRMAEILAQRLAVHIRKDDSHILELGCGTGNLSRAILSHLSPKKYFCNDLFPSKKVGEFLDTRCLDHEFILGDASRISWPGDLDLVCANAVFQWLDDPSSMVQKSFQSLHPGGILGFSTFLPDNFLEFRQTSGIGLVYYEVAEWRQLFDSKWKLLESFGDAETLEFSGPKAVLEHIRDTGVGGVAHHSWSREQVANFFQAYPHSPEGKCPLTYRYHFFVVQKKGN